LLIKDALFPERLLSFSSGFGKEVFLFSLRNMPIHSFRYGVKYKKYQKKF
jgi:hypothetical protein